MSSSAVSQTAQSIERRLADTEYRTEHRRWVVYMLTSTTMAILTAFFGLLLAGASLLRLIDPGSHAALIGTLLLMATFPLLVFSAHCLDRIEDANRANRVASYRQMVFGDSESEK
jgi:hypothetical protein